MKHAFVFSCLVLAGLLLAGCAAKTAPSYDAAESITDATYLTGSQWDDGQAEVAFYQVERTRNQYGQETEQRFLVGTYVVKHDFDRAAMSKARSDAADPVSSFKYALFYEFESGSYQYKRNYVVNAAQADLTPLKASFTSFDWCANIYREFAFHPNGTVATFMRSDDYGNRANEFDYQPNAYPVQVLPLLIRGLDFSDTEEHAFFIVQEDGKMVAVQARLEGNEGIDLPAGRVETERIVVTYDEPVPSLIGEQTDTVETYWRDTSPWRYLVRLESETGRYRMTLVESLRSAYWSEDLWPRLTQVTERP